MRTGLSKKQKTTSVFFDEASPIIEVCTYNTSLKGRFSFKLNAPYSAERRKAASELAKKNIQNLQQDKK